MITRDRAIELVKEERERQNKKWGFPQRNTPFEWVSIITEEVGEFAQAINDEYYHMPEQHIVNKAHIIEEAIQVAAVALSIIEHFPEE